MTSPSRIPIQALVTAGERPALARAAELLSGSLTQAGDGLWTVDCTFPDSADAIRSAPGPSVVVTSLMAEVDLFDEPWPAAEARLRAQYEALCADDRRTVFVCTLLRHVSRELPFDEAQKRRIRIRRLNFLAVELSREIGLLVADVDRDLADIGALALQTDYRLQGPYASAAAGKSMAMALLLVGLDAFAPFEIQDAARERLKAYRPPQDAPAAPALLRVGGYVGSVRSRQRTQVVEYADAVADDTVVASNIKRLLSGKIGLHDAAAILKGAVAARGLRPAAARLLLGLKKAAGDAWLARR